MTETKEQTENEIRQLSREESLALFDRETRKFMEMSREEFLRRLDAGEFDDIADDPINHPGITYLIMLSDSAR